MPVSAWSSAFVVRLPAQRVGPSSRRFASPRSPARRCGAARPLAPGRVSRSLSGDLARDAVDDRGGAVSAPGGERDARVRAQVAPADGVLVDGRAQAAGDELGVHRRDVRRAVRRRRSPSPSCACRSRRRRTRRRSCGARDGRRFRAPHCRRWRGCDRARPGSGPAPPRTTSWDPCRRPGAGRDGLGSGRSRGRRHASLVAHRRGCRRYGAGHSVAAMAETPDADQRQDAPRAIHYRRVVHLSHVLAPGMPEWPGDPPLAVDPVATIAADGYCAAPSDRRRAQRHARQRAVVVPCRWRVDRCLSRGIAGEVRPPSSTSPPRRHATPITA